MLFENRKSGQTKDKEVLSIEIILIWRAPSIYHFKIRIDKIWVVCVKYKSKWRYDVYSLLLVRVLLGFIAIGICIDEAYTDNEN